MTSQDPHGGPAGARQPGWYWYPETNPDGTLGARYWDGSDWTEHRMPLEGAPEPAPRKQRRVRIWTLVLSIAILPAAVVNVFVVGLAFALMEGDECPAGGCSNAPSDSLFHWLIFPPFVVAAVAIVFAIAMFFVPGSRRWPLAVPLLGWGVLLAYVPLTLAFIMTTAR